MPSEGAADTSVKEPAAKKLRAHVSGEKTIEERSAKQDVRFYCGWFCPFAQRAWIALEEKGVQYEYVPIDPYKSDPSKPGLSSKNPLSLAEKWEKYPEFMQCCPTGLVPGLEISGRAAGVDRIYESLVCVEYIDEAFRTGHALLPRDDPALRARVRIWTIFAGEKIIPHFYRMLMKPSAEEREAEKCLLLEGLHRFAEAMAPVGDNGGAYFLGDTFSFVDIALCPWWRRFDCIGRVYRQLEIPRGGAYDRLHAWGEACNHRPSVARTLVDSDRLTANYSGYADGTATSTVAKTLAANL